jgi:hypothetical protein
VCIEQSAKASNSTCRERTFLDARSHLRQSCGTHSACEQKHSALIWRHSACEPRHSACELRHSACEPRHSDVRVHDASPTVLGSLFNHTSYSLAFPETYTASLQTKRRDVAQHLRPVWRNHDNRQQSEEKRFQERQTILYEPMPHMYRRIRNYPSPVEKRKRSTTSWNAM